MFYKFKKKEIKKNKKKKKKKKKTDLLRKVSAKDTILIMSLHIIPTLKN